MTSSSANGLRWDGGPGHYEVYYLTLTDPATGVGMWIRYTMVAPLERLSEPATCSVWFLVMDPRPGRTATFGRKLTLPAAELRSEGEPFSLWIGDAELTDAGMSGSFEDVAWDLGWEPTDHAYEHVHPVLSRAGVAQTVLVLPHADLSIDGTVEFGGERVEVAGARGGQAHLWGSKHAARWAWMHCSDFVTSDGAPAPGEFVDAVSVFVRRFGREIGPSTPVVARVDGRDLLSTAPARVLRNDSTFTLTGWRFDAVAGGRRLVGEIDADRSQLVGVTYHDPDGELAYCYNGETASMRLHIYDRARQVGGWAHRKTLVSDGHVHFEYAQRTPVPGIELLTR